MEEFVVDCLLIQHWRFAVWLYVHETEFGYVWQGGENGKKQ